MTHSKLEHTCSVNFLPSSVTIRCSESCHLTNHKHKNIFFYFFYIYELHDPVIEKKKIIDVLPFPGCSQLNQCPNLKRQLGHVRECRLETLTPE
jgi:hypothetical protein